MTFQLIVLDISKKTIQITIDNIVLITAFFFYGLSLFLTRRLSGFLKISHEIELNISLGNIGKISIKPNFEVACIAHKAWTEIITRKVGLSFDEENDVIVEVYNSWYDFFKQTRELIKEIPASKIREPNTQKLIDLLVNTLNNGLRPHLTKYQASFRRWYENELDKVENRAFSPQEIQRNYPKYELMVADLKKINSQLTSYAMQLQKLTR